MTDQDIPTIHQLWNVPLKRRTDEVDMSTKRDIVQS